ncbi:MAG: 50S ribosomal protein L18 [Candidatus Undinarchaeales archaeon]
MGKRRISKFRRHKEGKTDYRKRLKLLKSRKPRLVVRRSLDQISVQVIVYGSEGDIVKSSAVSNELLDLDWPFAGSSIPSAYLTGYLCGLRALDNGVKKAVLDIGLYLPKAGSKLFAALKGAVDAGMDIPENEKSVPAEDRLKGKHIEDYASDLKKNDSASYKKRFSRYLDRDADPTKLTEQFEKAKKIIEKKAASKSKGGNT